MSNDLVCDQPARIAALKAHRASLWISLVILAVQLPFLLQHAANLWYYRPHYEFFPFVIVAGVFLLWRRWPPGEVTISRWSLVGAWSALGLGLTSTTLAVLLFSPWLAAVAFLLTLGGLLWRFAGSSAVRLVGPWLLLWVAIPPPLGLDGKLILAMQQLTATMVSGILEWGNIRHVLAGFVFELPDRDLFVAEACSGIHSQLVLVAGCLILSVYQRRGLIGMTLLAAAGSFWSLAANVTRVTIVVAAAAIYDIDLSSGWIHETIGYGLMLGGFLMLMSADQLLLGVLAPIERRTATSNILAWHWNRWIAFDPAKFGAPLDENRDSALSKVTRPVRYTPFIAYSALLALLGALQVVVLLGSRRDETSIEVQMTSIEKTWLPVQEDEWLLSEYELVERGRNSDQGHYSNIWRYASGALVAQISLDYPFLGWHELSRCYCNIGWKMVSRKMIGLDANFAVPRDQQEFVQVELSGPSGEYGFLLFSLFDASGKPVRPRPDNVTVLRNKFASNPLFAKLFGSEARAPSQATFQIQQFVVSEYPLTESEKDRLQKFFVASRDAFYARKFRANQLSENEVAGQ